MEESVKKVGLKIEEAADRKRWKEGVRAIVEGMMHIQPPSVTRKKKGLKLDGSSYTLIKNLNLNIDGCEDLWIELLLPNKKMCY